jgi:hypothetical protein
LTAINNEYSLYIHIAKCHKDKNMKASVIDLRKKMSHIIKALDRNEKVIILYHGKEKGILSPIQNNINLKVKDHVFFGMDQKEDKTVDEEMENLRGGRFNAF